MPRPAGHSKWNKIEHRLFSFISKNWRGQPLSSYEVIISLISATQTHAGLEMFARLVS
jgi:Rhodopirellula transposase DDE domain